MMTQEAMAQQYRDLEKQRLKLKHFTFPYRYGMVTQKMEVYEAAITTMQMIEEQMRQLQRGFAYTEVEVQDLVNKSSILIAYADGAVPAIVLDAERALATTQLVYHLQEELERTQDSAMVTFRSQDEEAQKVSDEMVGLQIEYAKLLAKNTKLEKLYEKKVDLVGRLMKQVKEAKSAHIQVTKKGGSKK